MTELSPANEAVREFLIKLAAMHADPMSYGIMSKAVDPDGSLGFRDGGKRSILLIHALHVVNEYEHEHGRPLIGALAVSKITGTSGKGFADVGRDLGIKIEDTPRGRVHVLAGTAGCVLCVLG